MSRVSKKITNWLYTVLQPQYSHTETAYRDIYRFLSVYIERGFKIRTAVYTSASGGSDLLVNLYGPLATGPTVFQINIWVPLNYPYADVSGQVSNMDVNGVPIVYVVPSGDQIIRPGNNVDSQGKVYLPFLAQWHNATASGQQSEQFNLISLMDNLSKTFERSAPIGLAPQISGPALPPKPPSTLVSPQETGGAMATNGPPLPEKLTSSDELSTVPQKYRSPPPLPGQIAPHHNVENHWNEAVFPPSNSESPQLARIPLAQNNVIQHNWPQDEHRVTPINQREFLPFPTEQPQAKGSKSRRKPPSDDTPNVSTIEDLMDQVTLESKKEDTNPVELQRIAHHINLHLGPENRDGINCVLPKINETWNKASALYSQLSHHNTQAKANIANLDSHVQYLATQVESVGQLNQSLYGLAEANKKSADEVIFSTSPNRKMPLDELVLPDSQLVRQLYDTVAEIGGYKDAIKLVGGTYKSEPELINDETLDSCVRSVRALSRELFWLEVTRSEIGRVMGLQ